ncbi:MAG: hypothetical protein R3C45_01785 [Phycisphaerales bacterium]
MRVTTMRCDGCRSRSGGVPHVRWGTCRPSQRFIEMFVLAGEPQAMADQTRVVPTVRTG